MEKVHVYSAYAYKEYEKEAREHNEKLYKKLKENNRVKYEYNKSTDIFDEYHVLENPDNLTKGELALLISGNGLHFGFAVNGDYIKIYTD
jgi:hypothetical protein